MNQYPLIAFIADVHVGNHKFLGGDVSSRMNNRFRETNNILKYACQLAKSDGCDAMVVCGDLFDTDHPEPPQVAAVQEALTEGPDTYIILGNHEMCSMSPRDHALASMDGYTNPKTGSTIRVIDKTELVHIGGYEKDQSILMVPFRPGDAKTWFEAEVMSVKNIPENSLVAFHLGVSDNTTAANEPWMMGSHDQIHVKTLGNVMDRFGLSAAFAGNWHQHMFWELDRDKVVYQIGALVPTGWNNPGGDEHYGSLVYYDSSDGSILRNVVKGPRYHKFSSFQKWLPHSSDEMMRARIEVSAAELEEVRAQVEAEMPMGYVEVVVGAKHTKQAAKAAAAKVKNAAYSQGDLRQYIHDQNLGVDFGQVEEEVRMYLQEAKKK